MITPRQDAGPKARIQLRSAKLDGVETAHMFRKGQFDNNHITACQQFALLAV